MSAKPETTFYNSVHRHLPPPSELHREKMANPYRGGTFDFWFSGKRDLWIEYKFVVLPKRDNTQIDYGLSALQLDWGQRRAAEGRAVWVIVGCKDGGVVLTDAHVFGYRPSRAEFAPYILTRADVARQIVNYTTR